MTRRELCQLPTRGPAASPSDTAQCQIFYVPPEGQPLTLVNHRDGVLVVAGLPLHYAVGALIVGDQGFARNAGLGRYTVVGGLDLPGPASRPSCGRTW